MLLPVCICWPWPAMASELVTPAHGKAQRSKPHPVSFPPSSSLQWSTSVCFNIVARSRKQHKQIATVLSLCARLPAKWHSFLLTHEKSKGRTEGQRGSLTCARPRDKRLRSASGVPDSKVQTCASGAVSFLSENWESYRVWVLPLPFVS